MKPSIKKLAYDIEHQTEMNILFMKVFRNDALRKQGYKCCYCREPITKKEATGDHVKPKSKGGTLDRKNIKAACRPCNEAKEDMPKVKFQKMLRNPPDDAKMRIVKASIRLRLNRAIEKACSAIENTLR